MVQLASDIIQRIERERKNLLRYYWWQIGFGSLFLVLVIVSSIVLGYRSERFWAYIIIPLLVTGSFAIYVQSVSKDVRVKLNQRAIQIVLPEILPQWRFLPIYKLDLQYLEALYGKRLTAISMRNALLGKVGECDVVILHASFQWIDSESKAKFFNGLVVRLDVGNVGELALERLDGLRDKLESCGKVRLARFNGFVVIGIENFGDILSLDLFSAVKAEVLKPGLERLLGCISGLGQWCETLS